MKIKIKINTLGKKYLSRMIPDSTRLRYLSFLPRLEKWRRKYEKHYHKFKSRNDMYKYLNNDILRNDRIDYLEFGVYKGTTIMNWLEINSCKDSRFYGFDTFTGLPEPWESFIDKMPVGHFDTKGIIPSIKDLRVSFIKGLFQDTLPVFLKTFVNRSRIVIHNDADLYSSTLFVLTKLNDIITTDTIIIFDEFSSILDEFRAFEDWCSSYIRDYEVIGVVVSSIDYYSQIAIRIK